MDPELRFMIGQMIMVGFKESILTEESPVAQALKTNSLGGVILYSLDLHGYRKAQEENPALTREEAGRICPRNILSPAQLQTLTSDLKKLSTAPLFIAVDMEGGWVSRLGPASGFPEIESPRNLGWKDDLEETARVADGIAQTLSQNGINVNLAPVVDLELNPRGLIVQQGRSFGSDPQAVYRHAKRFILSHRRRGLLTTLKHFPGLGSAGEDTHRQMAEVTFSHQPQELQPFSSLAQEGLADLIMTAHVYHRKWDEDFPVTLSARILQRILRGELGYKGVVISDDLMMGAIIKHFSLEEACVLAVNAGIDILLGGNNSPEGYDPSLFLRMFEALARAVEEGRISRTTIEAAYGRILTLKSVDSYFGN